MVKDLEAGRELIRIVKACARAVESKEVPAGEPITLSAEGTYDVEDAPPGGDLSSLTFQWEAAAAHLEKAVQAAQKAGIQALTVPGACAAIAALSIAGLPTDRFIFEGFLPAKTAAREQRLLDVKHEPRTLVFYEAKHRIVAFLRSMQKIFGDRRNVVVARELTKKFESVYHGNLQDVLTQIVSDEQAQKGEYVVIVEGVKIDDEEVDLDNVLHALLPELGVSRASKVAAKITGVSKNQCYQRALELSRSA